MYRKILLRMLTAITVISLLALMPTVVFAVGPVTLYVDSACGDDSNDGTSGNPFATINKAISTAQSTYPGNEVIVYLKAGDYIATEYISHANLTIEAFNDGAGNYDDVTIYPNYDSPLAAPIGIWTAEWIFSANNLVSKVGFTLSHVNLSGDNPQTPEPEDGSAVTGVYIYSADGLGTYFTLDDCTISNMRVGIDEKYSDHSTLSILNCEIDAYSPVNLDSSPVLVIQNSTLQMRAPESWSTVIYLNGAPTVDIQDNTIIGNNGVGRGIYEDVRNGTIANNTFLELDIALDLDEIGNLTVSGNYVETTNQGFDLETYYYNPVTMTVCNNTIINKALKDHWQTGLKLYLDDDTGGSTFNVYGNEIINFAFGLYYDGDNYSDIISLNLSNEGAGNKFRGNVLNMYIDVLRCTSKVDLRHNDWGTTNSQEVLDRIYFREVYPSAVTETAAATHEEAFLFDDTFTTTALAAVHVDDDYTSLTPGFGETHFNSISEAKSRVKSGGTVNVAEGLYDEQVFIFQPVTLHGANENTVIKNTAIDASKPLMLIAAPDTTVRGLNFQDNVYGLMVGDFDYCRTHLNSPLNFTYYDSMANNTSVCQNYFGNQSYASIYIDYQNFPDTLDGLTVEDNTFYSDTGSSYYALFSRNDFVIDSPIIKNNHIEYGYMNGFYLRFGGDALIQGNDIEIDGVFAEPFGNKVGLLLFPEGNGLITDNTIHLADGINHAPSENDSIGIRYDVGATPAELITADFYKNSFSGFDYALYFYGYEVNLPEGSIDVTVGGSNENYNDLRNNTYGVVSQYKPVCIDASYNLWGVADENIPDMILDNNDESYYGPVTYLPSATLTTAPALSDLQVSPVSLSPSFDPAFHEYTASAGNAATAISITPSSEAGTIYVNDSETASGSTVQIPLSVGQNTITLKVESGESLTTYTISVTRAAASVSAGGGGGSNTEPSIPVTTETVGNTIKTKTEIPLTASSGTATASISPAVIDALLKKADDEKGTSKNDVIEITVNTPPDTKKIDVSIQQTDLAKITGTTDAGLGIKSPIISVTFDGKALDTISSESTGGITVISAGIIDNASLSEKDRAKVEGRPVYNLSVTAGTKLVSHFGGGHATVSIPYTLSQGENPNSVVIYYLGSDGNLKNVRGRFDPATKTVVFKTTHFSKFVIGHNPVSFTDVAAGAWYKDAVDFISARGITGGTGNNCFSPDAKLTRGQFIVFLMNAYQIDPLAGENKNFADAGNTYYTNYLAAAKSLGLTKGTGDNIFAPEREITRQEMFVLLYNALKIMDELPLATGNNRLQSFNDANLISPWAAEALSSLVNSGIISGADNKLSPTETTTRAQMAQVLYKLLAK